MNKPVLIIMAAGMGSRYGGLKQIDPVDDQNHLLVDYSIYDAKRAGFETVVFVIKAEHEAGFRAVIGDRLSRHMNIFYAHQKLSNIPEGYTVPEGRTKPWGTAHAVLSAADYVHGPFAVINADDYYGVTAFQSIYDFLAGNTDETMHALVGYKIENTLTENGYVSRGICSTDENGFLTGVDERVHIEGVTGGAVYTEEGSAPVFIPEGTAVSMNLWGFSHMMMDEISKGFPAFLDRNLPVNPLKCEYFLPSVPNRLISEGRAFCKMLKTDERWYGVTYPQDKPRVEAALHKMKEEHIYSDDLWEESNA